MIRRNEFGLMKRKVRGKIIYYYWVYDENGKRVYRSTGERTKSAALEYVLRKRDEGNLGEKEKRQMTFSDFCTDIYIDGKCPMQAELLERGKGISRDTMYNRRKTLEKHILPYLGKAAVSNMTPSQINRWLLDLPSKSGLSRNTSNQVFAILSRILDYAVKQRILLSNPCKEVERLGNDAKAHESFTREEVRAVVGNEEEWNPLVRLMCLTSAMTGMRLGEVLALMPENVFPDRIVIKYSMGRKQEGLKAPKNGKKRYVPITQDLYNQLMRMAWGPGKFIFSLRGDKPLTPSGVAAVLRKRCAAVGVQGKTFHGFRAFFNSELEANNINETVIRSMVGHKSSDMSEHYLHLEAVEFPLVRNVQNEIIKGIEI